MKETIVRRDFLKTMMAGVPTMSLDWDAFPRGDRDASSATDQWDAVIIGAGLGGLSCAAAFARQGFKPLVLEQHSIPGGYATSFKRPGGFEFDVSLHSTSVGMRNGIANLIQGFPEIKDIEFVPHKVLYRAIFPDYDIRVPHRDVEGYIGILARHFPEEKEGIQSLFRAMQGLVTDLSRYSAAAGKVDMSTMPKDFPWLFKSAASTWGAFQDGYIRDSRLKAIISSLWMYFGLPPSRLASIYYAMPTMGYLSGGGYYPVGRSQAISNALVKIIEERGGKVLLRSRVEKILVKDSAAFGVRTADGTEHMARVVVSNANVPDTFHRMLDEKEYLRDYLARLEGFSVSLSSFQIFLGLKRDLIRDTGVTDSEVFCESGYDGDEAHRAALQADVEKCGFAVTLYDNLYRGYSPPGKNTLNIIVLQGYEPWKKHETDYFAGRKDAYRAEKERMADVLIKRAEGRLLPGLSRAIEVREVGTPLTNVRYTANHRGAIYGWDQTLDNSMPRRLPHTTPVKNLYLAGAWTRPGHGYGAVIPSGLECFAEIMKEWDKR